MDEDSNATFLMEDDAPLDNYSPSHKTKVKKKVLVGGGGMDSKSYPGHYLLVYQF
jgi:hypothetical protein